MHKLHKCNAQLIISVRISQQVAINYESKRLRMDKGAVNGEVKRIYYL